ncbi:FMN-binding protein [Microtetraspora sp. AC03309]|uniref:FMN-binding protein n=1 Tax=Microtetraspora sp. AC03309 TaxID=2779376 RepID=UPI001E2ED7D8|nr:FMN-binding protein [Microtetraspora sp. AC03309]MCC5578772.1 FMN-binding protein [Microtetraspora sp. AC03309]
MRRAILAVLATTVGLVLLLSFKPHEITASADRPSAGARAEALSGRDPGFDGHGDGDGDSDGDGFGPPGGDHGEGGVSSNSGAWTGDGASAGATSGDKTVTGDAADTRWGPVQVELVISGGKVTGVKVLQAPDNNHRDIAINNRALPILNQAALSAQSAGIDTVSGATYTSEGYITSLQSALDRAGL